MKKAIILAAVAAPFVTLAQSQTGSGIGGIGGGVGDVSKLVAFLKDALNIATVLILALAVVYFLWNVFKFVMSAGDAEAREKSQGGIIYGFIGIFVMVSLWGIISFFSQSAKLTPTTYSAPTINFGGN